MRNPVIDPEKAAALQVMAGAFLISFSGVYVKLVHVGPTAAGFYRNFFGCLLLVILVLVKRESIWKNLPTFLLGSTCGLFFALDIFVWHKSIHYVGPGLATILANFQVFFLAVFGVAALGERLRFNLVAAIPLAMVGLFMIVGIDWNHLARIYRRGVYLGLTTALCYTAYIISLRKLQSVDDPLSPMVNLAVVSFFSSVILGALARQQGEHLAIPDTQSFLFLFAYGLFSQVLGWVLISKGLPRVKASLAGLLLLLQPALAFIWDMLFFQRETTPLALVGAALTLAAIYMGSADRSKRGSQRASGSSTPA